MRVARIFPRRTRATPDDPLAFVGGPGLFPPDVDRVEISVTFSWDLPSAEYLAEEWSRVAPTEIGGPAASARGGDFEPGRYLGTGYVITSRGCPNRCWFCSVPKREGTIRELPIHGGYNVLDDNLLACSDEHVAAVFDMLDAQPRGKIEFTGGLEAARLQSWHVKRLRALRPSQVFFAYDTPDDLEPLRAAGKMLLASGWGQRSNPAGVGRNLRCYVLCGYPGDTLDAAEARMHETIMAGFLPTAMAWRNAKGKKPRGWSVFQRRWFRPAIIGAVRAGAARGRLIRRPPRAPMR